MFTACSPVCMTHPKITSSTIGGIDLRAAGHLAQHMRGEHDRVHVAKITVALVAAAHRRAHRLDDHDVSHGSTCCLVGSPTLAAGVASAAEAVDALENRSRRRAVEQIRRPALGGDEPSRSAVLVDTAQNEDIAGAWVARVGESGATTCIPSAVSPGVASSVDGCDGGGGSSAKNASMYGWSRLSDRKIRCEPRDRARAVKIAAVSPVSKNGAARFG